MHFTPAVEKLDYSVEGNTLLISGGFAWDKVYRVNLAPTALTDLQARPLDLRAESEVYVYFPRRPGFLKWGAAQGEMERFGPHMLPGRRPRQGAAGPAHLSGRSARSLLLAVPGRTGDRR